MQQNNSKTFKPTGLTSAWFFAFYGVSSETLDLGPVLADSKPKLLVLPETTIPFFEVVA